MTKQGIDPGLAALLEQSPVAELDHAFIVDCLRDYKKPEMKLHQLVESGALVRIKKGLYIFGDRVSKWPCCLETLANKIYPLSYVSLEWALQHYRLIPERVVEITSITIKRSKVFQTPLGRFSYAHVPLEGFSEGMDWISFSEKQSALIATPERAIVDTLIVRRGRSTSVKRMREILFDDFRFETCDIGRLNLTHLMDIHNTRPHSASQHLIEIAKQEKESE